MKNDFKSKLFNINLSNLKQIDYVLGFLKVIFLMLNLCKILKLCH